MIDAAARRRIAAAYAEHIQRTRQQFPGTLTKGEAARLGPADGPEPAPSICVNDQITAACERLFATHKGE